jgi:hypothetical protein
MAVLAHPVAGAAEEEPGEPSTAIRIFSNRIPSSAMAARLASPRPKTGPDRLEFVTVGRIGIGRMHRALEPGIWPHNR